MVKVNTKLANFSDFAKAASVSIIFDLREIGTGHIKN